jgi:hypothetical protein
MGGYETYLSAAIIKKHVPLIVVTDKDKADFTITSSVSQRAPTRPRLSSTIPTVKITAVLILAIQLPEVLEVPMQAYRSLTTDLHKSLLLMLLVRVETPINSRARLRRVPNT